MAMHELHNTDEAQSRLFRELPSVNDLLLTPVCTALLNIHPRSALLLAARNALGRLRLEIASGQQTEDSLQRSIDQLPDKIGHQLELGRRYSLRPVINATGVILHTNLGRAPLSEAALGHLVDVAQDYCNLELDLETGLRSRRDVHAESLVLRVLNRNQRRDSRSRSTRRAHRQ